MLKRTKSPLPFTMEELKEFETLALYLDLDHLADHFNVNRNTLYKWLQTYPTLGQIFRRARARVIASISQTLIKKAREGNMAAICFFLKTRAGYRETVRQEIVGKDGGPVETVNRNVNVDAVRDVDLSDFTDEELKVLRKLGVRMAEKESEAGDGGSVH